MQILLGFLLWFSSLYTNALQTPMNQGPGESLTACELLNKPEQWSGRMLHVNGYVLRTHNGLMLCADSCNGCIEIFEPQDINPQPKFRLEKDAKYEEFRRLSYDVALVKELLGKARMAVIMLGRFDHIYEIRGGQRVHVSDGFGPSLVPSRFVLQRVISTSVSEKTRK
jgi:hypothetical protein